MRKSGPLGETMYNRRIELDGWLLLVTTVVASIVGLVAYSFTTFETVSHAREQKETVEKRLDRIEQKIDQLLAK